MRHLTLALLWILLAVLGVSAGTIDGTAAGVSTGKRGSPSTQPGVVWLDGGKGFSTPKKVPTLAQHGAQFVPPFLIVVAGQTVQMVNQDQIAHGVYSDSSAKKFNLGYFAGGRPKLVTFDRPGLIDVRCPLHSAMHGTILVVPSPYYATVQADGSFHIGNIPAGKYSLNFWSGDGPEVSKIISVPEKGRILVHIDSAQHQTGTLK
jgi:plastocyanin